MIDTVSVMAATACFDSSLVSIHEVPPPDRMSSKLFIVKIQTGKEYGYDDPYKKLVLYDRSVTLDIQFSSPVLHLHQNNCSSKVSSLSTTVYHNNSINM
jgi:hypothetical protein